MENIARRRPGETKDATMAPTAGARPLRRSPNGRGMDGEARLLPGGPLLVRGRDPGERVGCARHRVREGRASAGGCARGGCACAAEGSLPAPECRVRPPGRVVLPAAVGAGRGRAGCASRRAAYARPRQGSPARVRLPSGRRDVFVNAEDPSGIGTTEFELLSPSQQRRGG